MPGGMQLKAEVLATSACSLCGACLDWCPYLKNLEDHLVLRFDCPVQDGRCYSVCPRTMTDWQVMNDSFFEGVSFSKELGAWQKIFRVKGQQPVAGQQDGGTVSALLKTALQEQMVEALLVTGSLEDPLIPSSYITGDLEEVGKSAGSRFLASPGLRKIMEIREKGWGKTAVVGRPCQIQALRKMEFNQPPDRPPLQILSIGLFCMWSLAWSFKDYLASAYPDRKFTRMNIPQHAVELLSPDGTEQLPVAKVKEFIRPGCSYCLDMTSELADISVGAFEAESGWNTVLVRSQQGQELLEKAQARQLIQVEEYPPEELQRLQQASLNKKIRALQAIKKAADEQRLTPFIDLSQDVYQEILAAAEGEV